MSKSILKKEPLGLELHARDLIDNTSCMSFKDSMLLMAQSMEARRVADMILKEPKFFTAKEIEGGALIELRLDCYVLTKQELFNELGRVYALGVNAGRGGNMPSRWEDKL